MRFNVHKSHESNPVAMDWIKLFQKNPDYKTMTGREFLLQLTRQGFKKILFRLWLFLCLWLYIFLTNFPNLLMYINVFQSLGAFAHREFAKHGVQVCEGSPLVHVVGNWHFHHCMYFSCAILFSSCKNCIESGMPSETVISSILLFAFNIQFRR